MCFNTGFNPLLLEGAIDFARKNISWDIFNVQLPEECQLPSSVRVHTAKCSCWNRQSIQRGQISFLQWKWNLRWCTSESQFSNCSTWVLLAFQSITHHSRDRIERVEDKRNSSRFGNSSRPEWSNVLWAEGNASPEEGAVWFGLALIEEIFSIFLQSLKRRRWKCWLGSRRRSTNSATSCGRRGASCSRKPSTAKQWGPLLSPRACTTTYFIYQHTSVERLFGSPWLATNNTTIALKSFIAATHSLLCALHGGTRPNESSGRMIMKKNRDHVTNWIIIHSGWVILVCIPLATEGCKGVEHKTVAASRHKPGIRILLCLSWSRSIAEIAHFKCSHRDRRWKMSRGTHSFYIPESVLFHRWKFSPVTLPTTVSWNRQRETPNFLIFFRNSTNFKSVWRFLAKHRIILLVVETRKISAMTWYQETNTGFITSNTDPNFAFQTHGGLSAVTPCMSVCGDLTGFKSCWFTSGGGSGTPTPQDKPVRFETSS